MIQQATLDPVLLVYPDNIHTATRQKDKLLVRLCDLVAPLVLILRTSKFIRLLGEILRIFNFLIRSLLQGVFNLTYNLPNLTDTFIYLDIL